MFEKLLKLLTRYRELIRYGIFGILTTGVDYGVFALFTEIFHVNESISNLIGWFAAVLFAFVTNKLFVFASTEKGFTRLLFEFSAFFGARFVTGLIPNFGFPLLHEALEMNGYLAKALLSLFNIVLNYFFSKFIVFRKKKAPDPTADDPSSRTDHTGDPENR